MRKSFLIFLILLGDFLYCSAQNTGTIRRTEQQKNAFENQYVYTPPKNLLMPEAIEALILYINKGAYYKKSVPAVKTDNEYVFSFTPPDSTSVIIIGILDSKKNIAGYTGLLAASKTILDNNNNGGFIFYQFDKAGNRFAFEKIQLAGLLLNYAGSKLDIRVSNDSIVKLYESAYRLHPEMMEQDGYLDYLNVLYTTKGDAAKNKLALYARKMELAINDETKWLSALSLYELLNMEKEKLAVETKILAHFPSGELAKQNFWKRFFSSDHNTYDTEEKILSGMKFYSGKFNDSSSTIKDKFYGKIVSMLLEKKEFVRLLDYDHLFNNKFVLARYYNKGAAELVTENINGLGADTAVAKMLSKKAIDYTKEYFNKLSPNYEYQEEVLAEYNKYISTYALILYQQEKYDSAFYYQDIVYRQGNTFNTVDMSRYVLFAERIKGSAYVKVILEQQIDKGISSPDILKQLETIYQSLNFPEHEFQKMVTKAGIRVREESERKVKAQVGSLKAKNFVLKDLAGRNISLSSFSGKVVVLVFWATWCVPCRASFPSLQKMIDHYTKDNEVVFLFIDVWENKPFKSMQEAALKIINDKKYDFNILFDSENTVVTNYNIKGIPIKFIIDKKGNIVFVGDTLDLIPEIEKAKK